MRILLFLMLIFPTIVFCEEPSFSTDVDITAIQINRIYDRNITYQVQKYLDLVAKEEKINSCVENYRDTQQKQAWARTTQETLYGLTHNFGSITERIYGKRVMGNDGVSLDEKLEALGIIQCEIYFSLGMIK